LAASLSCSESIKWIYIEPSDLKLLKINKVHKRLGDTSILRGIDLELLDGEFFVLLGTSGCGKTTLLRIIAGLEEPDSGSVYLGDRSWNDLTPQERGVAMVFQNFALYPHRSVEGNVEYPLRIAGIPAVERRERVLAVATMLGIERLLTRKPRELSGGEAQRVALARALVRRPACFLLDEPFGSLDAQLRIRARGDLKRLQRDLKVTTLHVTHDQGEALALGDRIGLMHNGVLAQVGTPFELLRKPQSSFVASFIGNPPATLIPAEVHEGTVYLRAECGQKFEFGSVEALGLELVASCEITIGIAGDRIGLSLDPVRWISRVESAIFSISAAVELVEGVEPDVLVHCYTPLGRFLFRSHQRPTNLERSLYFEVDDVLFFDQSTGLRINRLEKASAKAR
jgi:ABC-type sugar transport system ATPase subunit